MKKRVAGVALVICCLLAPARPSPVKAGGESPARAGLLAVGDAAPDWTLRDAEGREHSLSEYRGRVVVLDFWATWCALCSKVMPRMEKLHRKYGGQGVAVFGVSSFETGDAAAVMRKKNCTYGLLLKGEEIAPAYGVETLPVVCVIGPDGRVVYSHAGPDHKNLDAVVEKLLKGQRT
jgi:peroxiredoxin